MKFKTFCFIVIPLIFFGCGAYHYIYQPKDPVTTEQVPKNKKDMQQQIEQFHGRKR